MKTLRERMASALKAKPGATQAALARACGVSKASVSDWFSGKTNSLDSTNLIRASSYLGVAPEWLATGRGPMHPSSGPSDAIQQKAGSSAFVQLTTVPALVDSATRRGPVLGVIEPWDDDTPLEEDEVEIPLFKETEFAAGSGILAPHIELSGQKIRFAKSTLRKAGVDPANAACATNKGRSMLGKIDDGATIGIDRGRNMVKDGKIFALDHNGELRVKYLYRLPGGGLRLHSHNTAEYPDENYGTDWQQEIRVLGWVFWWSSLDTW